IQGTFESEVEPPEASEGEASLFTEFETERPTFAEDDLFQRLQDQDVVVNAEPADAPAPLWQQIVFGFGPTILLLYIFFRIFRRAGSAMGGLGGLGSSRAKRYEAGKERTTFEDVAGIEDAEDELVEIVDFLRNPEKYTRLGGAIPKGVLLSGLPGTGKTLLARAVAGEAAVPFFNLSATEFVEMFVGVGASRVRDLFEQAKKQQPSIVFIDELDAIGRRRGAGVGQGHDEREQTLNQLLDQMDGFEDRERVIVMAATNRPDVLDPALLRPGRFDREVTVDLPDQDGREAILRIHTSGLRLADDVDLEVVAKATMGMSGADLANIANEAALLAARARHDRVRAEDFDGAIDKVILGGPRQPPMDEFQRHLVATHEAGHAVAAWWTADADPVRKVSIVPHGRSGGATSQLPQERQVYLQRYLMARLAVLLGGRAAERKMLDETSTGAEADLTQATQLARRMVTRWGMGELGPMAYQTDSERPFLGYELASDREVSEETAARVDREVESLLHEREETVEELIDEHRRDLESLVKLLEEQESVTAEMLRSEWGPPASERTGRA
ncbi:MAG: ATP-dependent zinc metalloprotease FtsH, partial [Actinomycetota bacterium]